MSWFFLQWYSKFNSKFALSMHFKNFIKSTHMIDAWKHFLEFLVNYINWNFFKINFHNNFSFCIFFVELVESITISFLSFRKIDKRACYKKNYNRRYLIELHEYELKNVVDLDFTLKVDILERDIKFDKWYITLLLIKNYICSKSSYWSN